MSVALPPDYLGKVLRTLTSWTGALALVAPVLWAIDPFGLTQSLFVTDQFLSTELGLALCFVLASTARTTAAHLPRLLLLVAALGSLLVGTLLTVHFGSANALFMKPSLPMLALAVALMLLTSAAVAAAGNWSMLALVVGLFAFGYGAQFLGGWLATAPVRLDNYVVYLVFGGDGFIGRALEVMATTVAIYLLFGAAFEVAGGTAALDALATRLAGNGSGVAIKATVISSALFGLISGSATSNVVTSGAFTISAMRKMGVRPAMAGGIEAVSSVMGQVTPPVLGAAAFLMSDLTGIPYPVIALATAVPALICYVIMVHQGTWIGQRTKSVADSGELLEAPSLTRRDALHLLPVVTILGLMFWGDRMTSLAGVAAAAVALVVALVLHGPRETVRRSRRVAKQAARSITGLIVAGSALGVVVAVLNITGFDVGLTLAIGHLGETNLLLALLLTALAAFLLGTGMSTSGVYIVVGTLLAPGLVKLGVPLMAAHLFVLYWAMLSMITPPVAFAALAASSISGAPFSATAWASMRFGWMCFVVPFAFVYQPALVLVGTPVELGVALASTAMGLWAARRLVAPRSLAELGVAGLIVVVSLMILFVGSATASPIQFALLAGVTLLSLWQSLPELTVGLRRLQRRRADVERLSETRLSL